MPTETDITDQEIPCLPEPVHICNPTTSLADFAYDLANQAWSCLADTPEGLPGGGFYTWFDVSPPSCCDEVVVSLMDSRRFKVDEFGKEILNVVHNDDVPIYWQHELWVQLSRPCINILNKDGDLTRAASRQDDAYKFLVDVQTLICCIEEWLIDENEDVCGSRDSYYFRPTSYEYMGNCARATIPIVFGGDGYFGCNCCNDPEEVL